MTKLNFRALSHNQDTVGVDDCREPVGHDDQRAGTELLLKCLLNEVVSLEINVGGRFVEHKDLGFADNCPGETDQLLLADGKQIVGIAAESQHALR